jgi:hypothetical protein
MRIILVIAIIMLVAGVACAGDIIKLCCDRCGYESKDILEGVGMAGFGNTIIYCPSCKTFSAIPTRVAFESGLKVEPDLAKPEGKETFLSAERLVYKCPACGGKAFAYDGPLCPLCCEGDLRKEMVGNWD